MNPGSKFLFDFVNILELKFFQEGILDFSFYHCINQKILSTDRKQVNLHPVFKNTMLYKWVWMIYEQTPQYKPSEYREK